MEFSLITNSHDQIFEKLNAHPEVIQKMDSYELYRIILIAESKEEYLHFFENNRGIILNKICEEFSFFDSLSLIHMIKYESCRSEASQILNNSIKSIFSKQTLVFIKKIDKAIDEYKLGEKQAIYNYMFSELEKLSSDKASIILYNLNLFKDFNYELKKRLGVVEILISAYQKYDTNVLANNLYKGSSIIGCLSKNNNQYLVLDYIQDLLKKYNLNTEDIECIGGGSTSLVFKIGKSVLKLGEKRNNRKIYVNHRILASQCRKLIMNEDNTLPLFYVEIMKYINNSGITQEECDELQEDLLRQGLIWEDAKTENCGTLDEGDDNKSYLPVDYVEVAGIVDNPIDREQFMKRKRKVVVLDNDNITRDPRSIWK